MASTIQIKRNTASGQTPQSLAAGELAVNVFDRKLYVGNNASGVTGLMGEDFKITTQTGVNNGIGGSGQHAHIKLFNVPYGNTRGTVSNTIAFVGDDAITVAKAANGAITFALDNDFGQSFPTDSGTGAPSSPALTIAGGEGIDTSASGATITIAGEDSTAANKGVVIVAAGEGLDVAYSSGTATVSGEDATTSNKGVASFHSDNFAVSSGAVTIKDNGVINAELLNEGITLAANTGSGFEVALGETFNIVTGTATGLSATLSANTITVAGLDATSAIKGVAKFSTDNFSVSSGEVTIKDNGVIMGTETTGNYVATIAGTANEVNVSGSGSETATVTIGLPDDVTIAGQLNVTENIVVAGNTIVNGNLTVEGATTYVSSSTVKVDDSMLILAANNAAHAVDAGVYQKYVSSGTKYAGYFFDQSDNVFKFFKDTAVEPTTTVNVSGSGYALAQLDAVIDGGTF